MKLTFPHIIAYAVAALTAIATLQPNVAAVITAVLGPFGHYVPAGVALAGALLAFVHDVAPTAIPAPAVTVSPTVNKQSGFISIQSVWLLTSAILMIPISLAACSTVQGWLSSPTASTVITVAVDAAVATAEAKGVSATQINSIAKQALAADTGTAGTLSAVSSLVNAQVAKLNLPSLDLAAAQVLETALAAAITAKLDGNADLATAQAAVADVLNATIAASGG